MQFAMSKFTQLWKPLEYKIARCGTITEHF